MCCLGRIARLEQEVYDLDSDLKMLRDEEDSLSVKAAEVPKANSPEWEFLRAVKRLESKIDGLTTKVTDP